MKTALEARESDTRTILTKVALDSVFPHADEKCENRITLKSHQRRNRSQEKVHTRGERAEEICTYRVADNCDRATRRLPCWRK